MNKISASGITNFYFYLLQVLFRSKFSILNYCQEFLFNCSPTYKVRTFFKNSSMIFVLNKAYQKVLAPF